MTTKASSEGPGIPIMDPSTSATARRGAGFVMLMIGIVLVLAGVVGLLFLFMVPALVFTLMGMPLVIVGSRWFAAGTPRLARGPGRAD
jgi:hypothetical protein